MTIYILSPQRKVVFIFTAGIHVNMLNVTVNLKTMETLALV